MRRSPAVAALVAAATLLAPLHASGASAPTVDGRERTSADAVDAARRFLDRYVDADGRAVRHDQGADTVGEGQSYALVLALVADDDDTFDRVWSWTERSLRRPDGLLAHRAGPDGQIVDDDAATDADVVTAWALLRRGGRYTAPGRTLAAAVLEHETIEVPGLGPLLAAGPWATGAPGTLNPSYWTFPFLGDLEDATGDPRWGAVHDASLLAVRNLTGDGSRLPPDWVRADGPAVTATPSPGGDVPDVRYSLDAQRVPVWLATSRDGAARAVAADWWTLLRRPKPAAAIALGLDGTVIDAGRHPLPLVASAATAFAAGEERAGTRLLARARRLERAHSTYYGAAWVALGYALLTTPSIGDPS